MQIIHTKLNDIPYDARFFDIETTGLSWRSSHVYLIGFAHRDENGDRILTQWFLEHPTKERDLLLSFSDFLTQQLRNDPACPLVHYNGTTFDLPYLRHKLAFYDLADPFTGQDFDLYAALRPYRRQFSCEQFRQRDLEPLVGLFREDPYDGGELIRVYQDYLQSGDAQAFDALLAHNRADIEGLLALYPLRGIPDLAGGQFTVQDVSFEPNTSSYTFRIAPSHRIPHSLAIECKDKRLTLSGKRVIVVLTAESGRRRQYFSPPKDYYYLPEEDYAIHRSVGAFVDRAHRRPATAETCYQWVEGTFLPLYGDAFAPPLYATDRDRAWFRIDDDTQQTLLSADNTQLHRYLTGLLRELLH